jgi:hypothetical protein
MKYFAHPTMVIDPGAPINSGTKIWHSPQFTPGVSCENEVFIGPNTTTVGEPLSPL